MAEATKSTLPTGTTEPSLDNDPAMPFFSDNKGLYHMAISAEDNALPRLAVVVLIKIADQLRSLSVAMRRSK